jgi:hypothetical protein
MSFGGVRSGVHCRLPGSPRGLVRSTPEGGAVPRDLRVPRPSLPTHGRAHYIPSSPFSSCAAVVLHWEAREAIDHVSCVIATQPVRCGTCSTSVHARG